MIAVTGGTLFLALFAQIAIPLPFSPVPITGQTFGVALVGLLFGRKLGSIMFFTYLTLGGLGPPIFAAGKAGFIWGPTMGYLIGLAGATILVGWLADRGWAKSFRRAYLAATLVSVVIFSYGLIVLSFFLPVDGLFDAGLVPFLPGDFLENMLAVALVSGSSKLLGKSL